MAEQSDKRLALTPTQQELYNGLVDKRADTRRCGTGFGSMQ